MSDIETFLKENKLDFKIIGDNYQICCPMCTDTRYRLGIHKDTGYFHCFNCDSSGKGKTVKQNLNYLSRGLKSHTKNTDLSFKKKSIEDRQKTVKISIPDDKAETYHKRLFNKKSLKAKKVRLYLKNKRGFSVNTIKHFKLGIKSSFKKQDTGEVYKTEPYIAIPYFEANKTVNFKYRIGRTTDKKEKVAKWRRETGGKSSLFHDSILDDYKYDHIILAESELDAVSLYNAGVHNVVSLTVGAKGFKQEWRDRLARFEKIYIVLDNDDAGQKGARSLAGELGMGRCFNILLPDDVKDINDFFWDSKNKKENYSIGDFNALIKSAKRFIVDGVINTKHMLTTVKDNLSNEDDEYGIKTPWENVNKVMGSAKPGHLIVMTGRSKVGKTSTSLNWVLNLSDNKVPTLFYSCEMNEDSMGRNFIRMTDYSYTTMDEITDTMVHRANVRLNHDYLNFVYPKIGDYNLDQMLQKMHDAIYRYGIKFIVFDNLLFLARGIEKDSDKDTVGTITQRFKMFAESEGIVFVLITHPRKTNHNRKLKPDDMKDSSAIFQDLDTLIMVHREIKDDDFDDDDDISEGKMSELMEVTVFSRWAEGGDCYLYFNGHRGLLSDKNTYHKLMREKIEENKKKKRKSKK